MSVAVLSIGDKRLGAVLLERGYVTDEGLQQAIARHSEVGGRLADILIDLGIISEQRIARAIEESIGVPLVNLPRVDVMSDALVKLPAELANELRADGPVRVQRRHRVLEHNRDAVAAERVERGGREAEQFVAVEAGAAGGRLGLPGRAVPGPQQGDAVGHRHLLP